MPHLTAAANERGGGSAVVVERTWRAAMADALYGEGGFYVRGEPPARHFRTSAHVSTLFAQAVCTLLRRVDAALGHPDPVDLVDVGAGGGELLGAVAALLSGSDRSDRQQSRPLPERVRLTAVEVAGRAAGAAGCGSVRIGWTTEIPPLTGLLIANEWLDNVPVDIVVRTPAGPRLVLVDRAGAETLGPAPAEPDIGWVDRWWPPEPDPDWPAGDPAGRVEVGRGRDEAWSAAVRQVRRGVAVAIDYAHRTPGRPPGGTLVGHRGGRVVRPVPDGSADLTAHVALDACAAAGLAAGATASTLLAQREALRALGIRGGRPPVELASRDPVGYLRALARAGHAAELTDPGGLGRFGWLVQAVGVPLPLG